MQSPLREIAIGPLAALPLLLGNPQVRAATYTVSEANWGTSSTTNSFAWALAQANGNLGADTISITPGLAVNVDGATLIRNPTFVSSGGTRYTKNNVDLYMGPPLGTDILTQEAFSFAKLAPGVSLSIQALNSDGLNGYLQLREGSTASISQSTARSRP